MFIDAIIHSDTLFFVSAVNLGFFAKPRETGVRGASFVCMLTARFVLKYINVYHEVACDGNLYLVFLMIFFLIIIILFTLGLCLSFDLEEFFHIY